MKHFKFEISNLKSRHAPGRRLLSTALCLLSTGYCLLSTSLFHASAHGGKPHHFSDLPYTWGRDPLCG
jgi:hypothetical protein